MKDACRRRSYLHPIYQTFHRLAMTLRVELAEAGPLPVTKATDNDERGPSHTSSEFYADLSMQDTQDTLLRVDEWTGWMEAQTGKEAGGDCESCSQKNNFLLLWKIRRSVR